MAFPLAAALLVIIATIMFAVIQYVNEQFADRDSRTTMADAATQRSIDSPRTSDTTKVAPAGPSVDSSSSMLGWQLYWTAEQVGRHGQAVEQLSNTVPRLEQRIASLERRLDHQAQTQLQAQAHDADLNDVEPPATFEWTEGRLYGNNDGGVPLDSWRSRIPSILLPGPRDKNKQQQPPSRPRVVRYVDEVAAEANAAAAAALVHEELLQEEHQQPQQDGFIVPVSRAELALSDRDFDAGIELSSSGRMGPDSDMLIAKPDPIYGTRPVPASAENSPLLSQQAAEQGQTLSQPQNVQDQPLDRASEIGVNSSSSLEQGVKLSKRQLRPGSVDLYGVSVAPHQLRVVNKTPSDFRELRSGETSVGSPAVEGVLRQPLQSQQLAPAVPGQHGPEPRNPALLAAEIDRLRKENYILHNQLAQTRKQAISQAQQILDLNEHITRLAAAQPDGPHAAFSDDSISDDASYSDESVAAGRDSQVFTAVEQRISPAQQRQVVVTPGWKLKQRAKTPLPKGVPLESPISPTPAGRNSKQGKGKGKAKDKTPEKKVVLKTPELAYSPLDDHLATAKFRKSDALYRKSQLTKLNRLEEGASGPVGVYRHVPSGVLVVRKHMVLRDHDVFDREGEFYGMPKEAFWLDIYLPPHPHIIKLRDLRMFKGLLGMRPTVELYFDYCNGGDLGDFSKAFGRTWQPEEYIVWTILVQMGLALLHMHGWDTTQQEDKLLCKKSVRPALLHRDVKALNIFMNKPTNGPNGIDLRFFLGDLGLSAIESAPDNRGVVGTEAFSPPETRSLMVLQRRMQRFGKLGNADASRLKRAWHGPQLTQASDVWSLGATLWVIMTDELVQDEDRYRIEPSRHNPSITRIIRGDGSTIEYSTTLVEMVRSLMCNEDSDLRPIGDQLGRLVEHAILQTKFQKRGFHGHVLRQRQSGVPWPLAAGRLVKGSIDSPDNLREAAPVPTPQVPRQIDPALRMTPIEVPVQPVVQVIAQPLQAINELPRAPTRPVVVEAAQQGEPTVAVGRAARVRPPPGFGPLNANPPSLGPYARETEQHGLGISIVEAGSIKMPAAPVLAAAEVDSKSTGDKMSNIAL